MRLPLSRLVARAARLAPVLAVFPLAALAEVPKVVTDIPPVHSLVAQVMDDLGAPDLLLDQGASAHSFQMRPSQAAALAEADLVVWVGAEMTPWLDRSLDGLSADVPRLGLLDAEGTFRRSYGDTGHDHEGHDDHAEAGHDDHAEAGHDDHGPDHAKPADAQDDDHAGHDHVETADAHDHSGTDPHAWLDPANGRAWLGLIASELGRLDPDNAAAYTANAEAAVARIAALEADLATQLSPAKDQPFVVFHDAYGYFVDHFGLTVAGTIALGDAAAPGAARLAELRQTIGTDGALCIFPEAQHDPKMVEQMASETGTRVGGILDPEGAAIEPGPELYGAILTGLAEAISGCLTDA